MGAEDRGALPALTPELPRHQELSAAMFSTPLHQSARYRLLACLFLLASLLIAGAGVVPVSAQQPDSVEVDTTARRDTTTAPQAERKIPSRALIFSLGGTVVLTPAFGVGLLVGPSLGHFYAGDSQQAWIGIGLRTVGGGVFLEGVASEIAAAEKSSGPNAATVVGALIVGGSAIYDIVTASGSAREYNEAHGLNAQVTPTVGPRGEQVGLALRVSF